MSRKSILFIANTDWYLTNFRMETLKVFSESRFKLFTSGKDTGAAEQLKKISEFSEMKIDPGGRNLIHEFRCFFCIGSLLFRIRPDMIFSFNPKVNLYTAFWCFFLGLKLCPNISGLGELKKRRSKFDSLAIRCLVFLLNRCNFIFFQNSSDLEVLVDLGLKNSNVKVLFGSGVDLSKFPSQTVIKRTFDSPRLNIFMASRLIKDKGVEEFIKLANAFDKDRAKFFLAGVPDYSSRRIDGDLLNNSVSSGCLQFLGNINNVHEIMLSMDIFILPSRYSEGLPKSLLEACAAGMIIITSDSPGCSDVIKAGAGGILCKPQVDELFHALELLLNKPSVELKEMSINSRSIAEKHGDVHSNIQEYLKVVNSLC